MTIEVKVRAGADSVMVAWRSPFVVECRGFALRRRVKRAHGSAASPNAAGAHDAQGAVVEVVASWVGFADGPDVDPGTREPTTTWPIQKYLWSDFAVNAGDVVAYQVTPMTGPADALQEDAALASPWTRPVTVGARTNGDISAFFNRGIVASQWLARLLPSLPEPKATASAQGKELRRSIGAPGNRIRDFLSGAVRAKLVEILTDAASDGAHIYAALYELDDPELEGLLVALGKRAHVVLGNGSVKKKGDDQNADARATLAASCDLRDRLTAPRALAHNKFLVLCDKKKKPLAVWTGSTNWTKTGLCTQANNALLIENPDVAQEYLDQWKALAAAGDDTPDDLREANGQPRAFGSLKSTTLWFTPMSDQADLEQAAGLIAQAKEGILFVMFNPGPRGTLLNDIIELASPASPNFKPDLYIQGVVNQNPGTDANPVTLFNRGERIEANADVVLPAAIDTRMKYWVQELRKLSGTFAMVHSKVIVIDPFGKRPVVMTGSHNLGPKASGVNDENFLIIEGNGALAAQYTANIMEIYNQYRWRASKLGPKPSRWKGLADDDRWQIGAPDADARYDQRRTQELDFWLGTD